MSIYILLVHYLSFRLLSRHRQVVIDWAIFVLCCRRFVQPIGTWLCVTERGSALCNCTSSQ